MKLYSALMTVTFGLGLATTSFANILSPAVGPTTMVGQKAGQKLGITAGQKAAQKLGLLAGQKAGQKLGFAAAQKVGQKAGQKAAQKFGTHFGSNY